MFLLSTTGLQVTKKAFGMSSWKRNHPRKLCDFPGSSTKQHQLFKNAKSCRLKCHQNQWRRLCHKSSEVKLEISGRVFPTNQPTNQPWRLQILRLVGCTGANDKLNVTNFKCLSTMRMIDLIESKKFSASLPSPPHLTEKATKCRFFHPSNLQQTLLRKDSNACFNAN